MNNLQNVSVLTGRLLLSAIFLVSGFGKIAQYAGTQAYMAATGVPGGLLPLVIALEVGGGLAIAIGWKTRWAAIALAGFSIAAGVLFHANFADQMQSILFMKNLAIAGGFLTLFAFGPGAIALDGRPAAPNLNQRTNP